MRWLTSCIAIVMATLILRYRYRVLNKLLSKRWLRRLSVAMLMRIPAVREKMIYETFR
ncbi:sodium:proton antiporter [Salipaludibacillus agaradhaerens]|jgi:hypothetical protein|uniref:Sodium:proton antiporter n=1 Tax=Salipaludibacillus agaradhaerens TaxID=76935 RepID=A0A9Q4FZ25_SALAG|nr:sodium:proton antiporter [Salipaludibacillus agaradhaerens]MCR6096722.1 sodium:proton antiporter [Salipaludibacillus agaradhaerens]MCR6106373.1 sodium:proton antiporter [Salipaludibacillus agaradhaerens]MCR6113719.1 sodium:proton antiporter [Salipaludibacillus agaradhaerens]MCR6118406.1 sodium:proton antiporter [Salipaludibacillus agaradhaerens]